MEQRLYRRG